MTKIMIDRELLERLLYSNSPARFDATEYNAARAELFAIIANPTQQGEAVEVVPVELLELLHEMVDLHERRGTVLTVQMEELRALLGKAVDVL